MNRFPFLRRQAMALVLIAGLWPTDARGAAPVPGDVLVVVVSQSTPLAGIRLDDLRRLFLDEMIRDADWNKLVPLNQVPGSSERTLFDSRVLGMAPDEMARFWIDRKVRGDKGAPRSVAPAGNLARLVAKFKGTITFIRTVDMIPGLKIVKIDGRGPGDAGYAFASQGR